MAQHVNFRPIEQPHRCRRICSSVGSSIFARRVILVRRHRDQTRENARIEGNRAIRIPGAGRRREGLEVRCLRGSVHGVRPIASIEPPAGDPIPPALRPLADNGFPSGLEFAIAVGAVLPLQRLPGLAVAPRCAGRQIRNQPDTPFAQRRSHLRHQIAPRALTRPDPGKFVVSCVRRRVVTGVLPNGQNVIARAH